jgi:hypothetical protein
MTTKPKKPLLPPRLQKRQNAGGKNPLGKNPLGKLLGKIPGLKGLASSQKQKVDQTLSAHKSAALEKEALTKATHKSAVKPQKLAAGGAAKVRLGQVKIKGVGSSFKELPKPKNKSKS